MLTSQSDFLQALGWAVFDSLWQMGVLWLCYQLITGVFRSLGAVQRNTLASTLLLAGFGWFVYDFTSSLVSGARGGLSAIHLQAGVAAGINDWLARLLPYASLAYLFFLLLPLLQFVRNYRYVQVIRRQELSKPPVEWRLFAQRIAEQIGIKKKVNLWISGIVSSPLTIGYWKPVILLPVAAISHLTPKQVETILLHELAHIRRFDYLVNLLSRLVQTILYFNPFVRAFIRIQETERERSADEMVLQFQYDQYGYASTLLALGKLAQPSRHFALHATGRKNELLHRVEWIMGVRKRRSPLKSMAAAFIALLSLAIIALLANKHPKAGNELMAGYYSFSAPSPLLSSLPVPAEHIPGLDAAGPGSTDKAATEETMLNALIEASMAVAEDKDEQLNTRHDHLSGATAGLTPIAVSYVETAAPRLTAEEEKQLKEAAEASKKVLSDITWKEVEPSIADAMTTTQKSYLKLSYEARLDEYKADWEKQMRQSYDQIDWPKFNATLQNQLALIQLDSLSTVYSGALADLNRLKGQLLASKEKGIPDTDITVEKLERKSKELQRTLNKINTMRERKVVHL